MRSAIKVVAAALAWTASSVAFSYQPEVNYQIRCMGCHLPDGSGTPGRVPSVRRSLVLFSAIPEGRDYVIRVPGVAQSPLSDADTAALLNWMARNLTDVKVSTNFTDYSETEVHGLRDRPLAQVKALRARLWKASGAQATP